MLSFKEFLLLEAERINTSAVDPELVHKASQQDSKAVEAVSKGVFGRSFELADRNTADELKPMDLSKLIKNFEVVEKFAKKFGYKFRYFTSDPDNVRTLKNGIKIEMRPKDIKEAGYKAGNIWVYDPFDPHGSFNDSLYTKIWREIHELAHAITERIVEEKYGWSRRFGAMSFDTKNPYDINDHKTYKAIPLIQAQRAIEWEACSFIAQVELYKELGVHVPKGEADLDFNIAGHDTVVRILTGDFTDPGSLGVIPNKKEKVDIKDVLQFLENQYKANAEYLGKKPEKGIDLSTWKEVTVEDIKKEIEKAKVS